MQIGTKANKPHALLYLTSFYMNRWLTRTWPVNPKQTEGM